MADYIRARSDEHKEERLSQIKEATAELFASCPYSEITLTTIAEKLGWSRANLYKYVTTKEEIFLEISAEKMATYYNALLSAFPDGNNFTPDVITEVWAGIVNANQDYMRYVSYLNPVIETNVSKTDNKTPNIFFILILRLYCFLITSLFIKLLGYFSAIRHCICCSKAICLAM